jgi:hypothetical protein
MTPQEVEAELAEQDLAHEAEFAERKAEAEADAELSAQVEIEDLEIG